MNHFPRRRSRRGRQADAAWDLFGPLGEAMEDEFGIPAGIFVEAAAGMMAYRPLACAVCDSGHSQPSSVCVSALKNESTGEAGGPFVIWSPCHTCFQTYREDVMALSAAAERTISMWLLTHQFPGSVAVIDEEGDPHAHGDV